jgi:hypothetical protein
MNSFSRVFLFLVAALASAADFDSEWMKIRFLRDDLISGIFKVPPKTNETKSLRGTTPSGSYIKIKNKGSGNPSPNAIALVHSVAPKSTGGTIPKGLFGGTSRGGAFGGGQTAGGAGKECNAAQVILSFEADDWASLQNAMYLFDAATYDSETGSLTEEPIWDYRIGDLTEGREYNLEECLDETGCYVFMFVGKSVVRNWLKA